ncbi:hypothetical protein D3C76_1405660 [compost metagenome]
MSRSWKNIPPISTPISGVVALKMAEYPAGSTWAATEYRVAGIPELITPSSITVLSLPLKSQLMRISPRISNRPVAAIETRKNAVGIVPITGAMMRMNRKLAPQMAASDSKRTISTGFTAFSFLMGTRVLPSG